ncbi:hypothetical protein [Devosia sp.]|uniref:hypothetical protein n=1 Tax=Devosia sp. TaxID=1871048 RepID=UPI003A924E7E
MSLDLETRQDTQVAKPRRGLVRWVLTAAAVISARMQLGRIVRQHQSRGSPPVPRHLRQDLGLPPEPESRRYWDHQ